GRAGRVGAMASLARLRSRSPVDLVPGRAGAGRRVTAGCQTGQHQLFGRSMNTSTPESLSRCEGATMSARSSGPVLATVLDTPAGPLSLLAHDDTLVGAGFTGDPGSLHARLEPALRAAPLPTARPPHLAWLVDPLPDSFAP